MTDPKPKKIRTVAICKREFLASYIAAIESAGGCVADLFDLEMTLEQMAETLAQNGVRFIFDKSKVVGTKI